jgi:hypothetical protein
MPITVEEILRSVDFVQWFIDQSIGRDMEAAMRAAANSSKGKVFQPYADDLLLAAIDMNRTEGISIRREAMKMLEQGYALEDIADTVQDRKDKLMHRLINRNWMRKWRAAHGQEEDA